MIKIKWGIQKINLFLNCDVLFVLGSLFFFFNIVGYVHSKHLQVFGILDQC